MRTCGASLLIRLSSSVLAAALLTTAIHAQMVTPPRSKAPLSMVMGEPRSLQVGKPFGVLTDTLPIIVPPGRHGVEPHISLTYNSGSGDGILGMGWDLNLGYIELDQRNGFPATPSADPDTYNFSIAGLSGELVNSGVLLNGNPAHPEYRSRTELVDREFIKEGDGWAMLDGQGNMYYFGSSHESRIDGRLWLIDSISDPKGNTITFHYMQDQGAFYPSSITYTDHGLTTGANLVTFSYETRPDVRKTFTHGISETRALRLTKIEADTLVPSQQMARAYQFSYGQTASGQSTLTQVLLVGDDGTSTIPLRSAMRYTPSSPGWSTSPGYLGPWSQFLVGNYGSDSGTRMVDIDGDGCADEIISGGKNTPFPNDIAIYMGDCTGLFGITQNGVIGSTAETLWNQALIGTVKPPPIVAPDAPDDSYTVDNGVRFMDVNGDGRTDIIIASAKLNRLEVWLNTYDGQNPETIGWKKANWKFPDASSSWVPFTQGFPATFSLVWDRPDSSGNTMLGAPTGVNFADVNGDGLPDIVWSICEGLASCGEGVYLNDGSGWVWNQALSAPSGGGGQYLHIGGFEAFIRDGLPTGWDLIDVNGDGRADLIYTGPGMSYHEVGLFDGVGWNRDQWYRDALIRTGLFSVNSDGTSNGFQAIDYNHDGLADLIQWAIGSPPKVFANTGTGFAEDTAMEAQLAGINGGFVGSINNGTMSNSHVQTATFADINGDGIPDLITWPGGYTSNVYFGGACSTCSTSATGRIVPGGLLRTWQGPLGEQAFLAYDRAPSTLPLPMFVPTILLRSEARTDQGPTTYSRYEYSYEGGTYTDRRFLGYQSVTETDPQGNSTYTLYDQRELFAGQEIARVLRDPGGFARYEKKSDWEPAPVQVSSKIQQGVLLSTDEYFQDPDPSGDGTVGYQSHASMQYDTHLNVTQLFKSPNTSEPGLGRTTVYAWATGNFSVWSLPSRVTLYQGAIVSSNTVVSDTTYQYDGQPVGTVWAGVLTAQNDATQMKSPAQYVTRTMQTDQYGNVTAVTDRNGNTATFSYDPETSTNRVSATDAEGHTIQSTFDRRFGSALTDTDASGNVTSYQYDPFGRIAKVVKPGDENLPGGTTSYVYSHLTGDFPTGLAVVRSDAASNGGTLNSIEFYNGYGQVYQSNRYASNAAPVWVTTDYDDLSMPIRVSHPFTGKSPVYTTITRDSLHRITQIQDPDGGITTRTYAGLMVAETDRRGKITVTQFNPSQQVEAKALTAPGGGSNTTQYVYDVNNQLTQVIRANGATTTMTYDMLGRKTSMSDPNTGTFTYQYDNEGHVTATTSPDRKTIRYTYNKNGDLLSKTYPDGTRNTVTYGAAGQPNAVGRVVSVKDAAGTVQFAYDARGRVIQHKRYVALKEKTYVTGYAFDPDDRLVTLTYPDGFAVNYGYDPLGNINSVVDSTGKVVANNFTYTPSGRLTGLQYGNGTASTYAYDVLDRMVSLRSTSPNGTAFQNLAYTYDADSNLTQIQDASGRNQHFAYDSMNRLISAQGDGIDGYGQETYSYDSVGNLLTKGAAAFGMDPVHTDRAVCMTVNAPGSTSCAQTPLDSIAINYDVKGNVIQMGNMQYTYDAENHMIAEGSNGAVVERNVYDFWGDRVVQQTAGDTRVFIDDVYEEGASGIAHHVKTQNLLLATIVTPLGSGSKSISVAKTTVPVYSISPAPPSSVSGGQFLAASMGFSVLIMFFCSFVRVTRQGRHLRVHLGAPVLFRSESIRVFKSVLLVVLIFSFVAGGANSGYALGSENGSAGSGHGPQTVTTTTTTTKTTVAPSPKRFYYHMNHLGGVHVITDDSAKTVEVREYKPYGETYVHNSSAATPAQNLPFGFDGQRMDGASNLYFFKARFYSPLLGRFLSADSEINNPTTPQALNRYAFAGGNPIRYIDPSGHSWYDFLIGAVIFIAVVGLAFLSGGAAVAGAALVLGLIGFGVGAGVAAGMGYNPSGEDFWQIAMTGAILGAAIGAGGAQILSEWAEAAASDAEAAEAVEAGEAAAETPAKNLAQRVSADMVKSAMFGGPQSFMIHELNGGGTDNLLLGTAEGTGEAAISGAVAGRIKEGVLGSAGRPSALKFWRGLGLTTVVQGGMWTFAGLKKQSFGSWAANGIESRVSSWLAPPSGRAEAAYQYPAYGSSGTSLLPINEVTPY